MSIAILPKLSARWITSSSSVERLSYYCYSKQSLLELALTFHPFLLRLKALSPTESFEEAMPPRSSPHAADDTKKFLESAEDIPNIILSLTQQMRKMHPHSHISSAYDKFVSDPQSDSKIEDPNSLLASLGSRDLCPVVHFINATLPKDLAMTLGIPSSPPNPLSLFHAIQAFFLPALEENKPIQDQITNWQKLFSLKCRLNIQDNKLEGLFLQLTCSEPSSLNAAAFDQLVSSTIIASSNTSPSEAFVAQSANPVQKFPSSSSGGEVHCPPYHLLDRFSAQCFYCGEQKPPKTPEFHPPTPLASKTSRIIGGRVSQVSFLKDSSPGDVLANSGVSTHLTGALEFVTAIQPISPFNIFLADYKTMIEISQIKNLKIPITNGWLAISNVPFLDKISGTVLSLGQLVRAGVLPVFEGFSLFLYLRDVSIPTVFNNNVWWIQTRSLNTRPSIMQINVAQNLPKLLTPFQWHRPLGHACDKTVKQFLKENVPGYNVKSWTPFYCDICARAKSTHCQAKNRVEIPKDKLLDLLVSDVLGLIK
ncbi:hypothetical protein O181_044892 [Austropuccinia psidii MF-1]|uniref:GAG-pre-integrase domain-containing protein n=1 Tax=Austropuccinia psidii MF-1 TaxID=1389203 RepID=A0A9Q3DNB0_9BASI|nr:hypothetical protein [Austropuccinia psidii MF-1]